MENRIKVKIKQCYDTEENYITNNPVLLAGQLAYTEDRYGEYKIGDGTHAWNELEYVKNYFIGTKAEYTEANNKGLIRPGMIICITDDNDYCNIPVDDEMDETSEHVVLNNTITKYVNTHDLKDNRLASSKCTFDGGVPFAGAKSVSGSLGDFLTESRSGFYTVVMKDSNNTWYNVISSRHRNGADDGNNYGLMIMNAFAANSNLVWDKQSPSGWQGQRTILDSANYPNLISRTNNQFYAAKGIYTAKLEGTAGTQGFIKFATIKIKSAYANYPCVFIISGRGRALPLIVSVHFQSANNNTPALLSLTQTGDASYYVYIHNEGNGVWSLYAGKNEAWGRVDILNEYYSDDHFEITHPGTQTASLPSGYVAASVGGLAGFANAVRDAQSNTTITFSYNKAGMNYGEYTWLAGWNGYELRAVNKNQFMAEVYANNYWGMAPNGDTSLWVRTTSQGIIPYQGGGRGGGHQYLGTDSWYFANSYIDHMHGVDLNLSNNIISSLTTTSHINGAKGGAIINSTASGNGNYNMLAKMNSTNGIFNIGYYQSALKLYYISNSKINANQNGYDKEVTLLNESGNTGFPGQVSAANFSAGGSSAFTTATISNLTVNGSMRLKNSTNYGMKLNFGDGDYVYLHEDTDDHLTIYGRSGITLNSSNNVLVPYCLTVGTGSGNGLKIGSYGRIVEASRNVGSDNYSSYVIELFGSNNYNYPHVLYRQFNSDFQIFPTSNGKGQYGDNYANMWYCIGAKTLYSSGGGVSVSDRNLKKDFELITDSLAENIIDGLIPTSFKYIDGDSGRRHYGLIAQDVEYLINKLGIDIIDFAPLCKVYPDKVIPFDVDNEEELVLEKDYTKTPLYHLRYEGFIGFLIKYSQNLKKENIQLKERVQILEERLSSIEDKITLLLNKS